MASNDCATVMLIIALAMLGCDPAPQPASTQPAGDNPAPHATVDEPTPLLIGDVVYSRNLQALGDDYAILPQQYRLGTAYVRTPPEWWKELVAQHKLESQAIIFPLVFVGLWTPKGGAERLVVLQMRHRFSGDGFWTPGPEMWLAAYVFEQTPSGKWSLLWKDNNAIDLGQMQNARFLAGRWEQKPTTIALQFETQFGDGKMGGSDVTSTISPQGKVSFSQPRYR